MNVSTISFIPSLQNVSRMLCLIGLLMGAWLCRLDAEEKIGPLVDAVTKQPVSRESLERSKDLGRVLFEVPEYGPAAAAGLRAGDTILAADGFRLYEPEEYGFARFKSPGRNEIGIVYNSGGIIKQVKISGLADDRIIYTLYLPAFPALPKLIAELQKLGVNYDQKTAHLLRHYPARAVAAYQEWRATVGTDAAAP